MLQQIACFTPFVLGLLARPTCQTHDRKVACANPSRSGKRIFFFRVNFVHQLLFNVHSTPVLLQWHTEDASQSTQSAGGRLHVNKHTPLTQQGQSELTMLLSRHSVGTYLETSSHATCQGKFVHNHLSSLSIVD